MKNHFFFKNLTFILFCISLFTNTNAQVKLSTNFTDDALKKQTLHNVWDVANRISPENGSNIRPGLKMNIVRMIGGIKKTINGENVKDLDFDPCIYDSINNKYVYRWDVLIDRLDKVINSQTEILQITLDQPPWAFQHGYTFIPEGTRDNINFRENEQISIYGNSLPPKDKAAYSDFIKALMTKLVETYGEEKVLSWRFRVGSEIETPDHWFGTKQDFIEHFANTEQAVRSILPNAKIGLHTRNPGFLFRNGSELNYKGEPFASFIEGLIDYNFDNNIKCDFWGLSDYIIIGNSSLRDMNGKYTKNFAPLVDNPKWNPETTIDLMEYATVTTMNGADGKGYINCATSHKEVVELIFSNEYYKNSDKGLEFIYRWGNRTGSENPEGIKTLNTMLGKTRYETLQSGTPKNSRNELDAIFTKSEVDKEYDAIIYNFNANSINYIANEAVTISMTTESPVGTTLYYRNLSYGKENNKLQNFLINNSGFVKSGFDNRGAPNRILTEEGFTAYESYENPNPYEYNQWKSVVTTASNNGGSGSVIEIDTEIGSFAFQKFEVRTEDFFVQPITPSKVVWTTTEDFEPWSAITSGMTVNKENDILSLNFSDGFGFPMAAITNLNINSDLFETLRFVMRNSTEKSDIQMAANVPGSQFASGRKKETVPNDNQWHTVDVNLANWSQWTGTITEFKIYNSVKTGAIEIDKMELIPFESASTFNVTLTKQGNGLLNYKSGTSFAGQEFNLNAIPEEGWKFEGWTGDIVSSENPLTITVNSDLDIKAVFSETNLSVSKNKTKEKIGVFPNPSSGIFNLQVEKLKQWEVYNINGVRVLKGNSKTIDLSAFAKGIFILKIESSYTKLLHN